LAQTRAAKGHLPQETAQCTTPEILKRVGCENKQLPDPYNPPDSNKKVKRTSNIVARGHSSANQRELFSDKQAHAARKDDTVTALLQNGDRKSVKTDICKYNVNQHYDGNGNSKDLMFSSKNLDSIIESSGPEESSSCVINAVDRSSKGSKENFQEQTYTKSYSHECNQKLKLDTTVEYASDKLVKLCDGNRGIRTGVLPCEMESCRHLHDVSATMSIVLQPSESNSFGGEDKLNFPIKVDASCGDGQWETIGIAALPDAEVGDVMVSLCKCAKTMHVNCTLSQKHTVTNSSGETVTKNRKFESKLYSDFRELKLPYKVCQKGTHESKNHQMSITSYFQLSRRSSLHIPTEGASKDVISSPSCAVSEDCCCFKQNDANTSGKECVQNLSKPSKPSKCLKHRIT
jgi:hypothetical protein